MIDVYFYGHDAMVSVQVDNLDAVVNVRIAGPVDVQPGDRTGVEISPDPAGTVVLLD